jgi:hypothetical protein
MLSSKSYKRNTKHYTKNWRIRKHIASSCSQTTTSSPDQPKSTRSTSRILSSTKGTLSLQPLLDHPSSYFFDYSSDPFFDYHSTYHSTIATHSSTILPSILPAIPQTTAPSEAKDISNVHQHTVCLSKRRASSGSSPHHSQRLLPLQPPPKQPQSLLLAMLALQAGIRRHASPPSRSDNLSLRNSHALRSAPQCAKPGSLVIMPLLFSELSFRAVLPNYYSTILPPFFAILHSSAYGPPRHN